MRYCWRLCAGLRYYTHCRWCAQCRVFILCTEKLYKPLKNISTFWYYHMRCMHIDYGYVLYILQARIKLLNSRPRLTLSSLRDAHTHTCTQMHINHIIQWSQPIHGAEVLLDCLFILPFSIFRSRILFVCTTSALYWCRWLLLLHRSVLLFSLPFTTRKTMKVSNDSGDLWK